MKKILGLLMILTGIILGFYVGIWVFLIGGIMEVIEAMRAEQLIALDVAIGIAKFLCAGLAGWVSALFLILPGMAFISMDG